VVSAVRIRPEQLAALAGAGAATSSVAIGARIVLELVERAHGDVDQALEVVAVGRRGARPGPTATCSSDGGAAEPALEVGEQRRRSCAPSGGCGAA
jgi:hypothetical protein